MEVNIKRNSSELKVVASEEQETGKCPRTDNRELASFIKSLENYLDQISGIFNKCLKKQKLK